MSKQPYTYTNVKIKDGKKYCGTCGVLLDIISKEALIGVDTVKCANGHVVGGSTE